MPLDRPRHAVLQSLGEDLISYAVRPKTTNWSRVYSERAGI
jgi:hypothetical protein